MTGLSGFVGQHILKMQSLIGAENNLAIVPDNPSCDLCDQNSVNHWVSEAQPDWVIHLAAQSNVPYAFQNPEETLRVNLLGTLHLLQALDQHGFTGRLLYVSSGDVYGLTPEDQLPIEETQPPNPGNPYAVSKISAEALCMQWAQKSAYEIMIARPFNHIGPGQRTDFVVPSIAQQISTASNGSDILVGDIDVTRDFLDVRDVVSAYFKLLELGKSHTVYNVCSGQERQVRDLALTLANLSGKTIKLIQDPARFRPADQRRVCGDNTRLIRDTGWKPRYSLEQTLQDVLQSFQSAKN